MASSLTGVSWIGGAATDPHGMPDEDPGPVVGHCAAEIYRYAAQRGELASLDAVAAELGRPVPEVSATVTRLKELRLLREEDVLDRRRLVPADPADAVSQLISPLERESYRSRDRADRLRAQIEEIAPPQCGSIDGLDGAAEIRGMVKLASEVCRREVLVLRPGHAGDDLLEELLEACHPVLDRGVTVRMISPHSSRAGFDARARAKRLVDSGAQIRTVSRVPQAAIVFDGGLAVVLGSSLDGTTPVARRVRDREVVQFLVDLFDQLWEDATVFGGQEAGYADALDNLQRSIVRLMAQGYTDEVVARRLGMSVRTCRRHIAALLQNLDAVSRFQAGMHAARRFTAPAALGA